MRNFIALVHKDPDSSYGLSFPDLPGCFSAADESEDMVANGVEALELWFEDQPWVEPGSIEAIRDMVADDLRDGAFLLAIPYPAARGLAAE